MVNKKYFLEKTNIGLTTNEIYFEDTLENKVERIKLSKCDWFFDDLPEVLHKIDNNINGCLYDPQNTYYNLNDFVKINNWAEANKIFK